MADLFGAIFGKIVNSASDSLEDAIGDAVGNSIGKVASQATTNLTGEMARLNERQNMALEEEKKAQELPGTCPRCGAPTNKKIVCEYCDCKIVE